MKHFEFVVLGFLIGVVLTSILFLQFYNHSNSFTGNIISTPTGNIADDNITVYSDKIVIKIPNASISNYASTGSMIPTLNQDSHGIRIIPKSESEINIGDLVSFNSTGMMIIHRVIQKGIDSQGTFFITRGDASQITDPMIRFSDIEYKTVGILY